MDMKTVDLKAKPYYLTEEDIAWVEKTIADMSLEEKIGQLFYNMGSSRDEEYLKMTVEKYHIGGIRYNPASAEEIYEQNRILQENSKIPLIIACNTEAGANRACDEGTVIGEPIKIGATQNPKYAYELGRISNKESAALGCNLSFAPIADIYYNWRNRVISRRAYGNDPELVAEMSLQYMLGARSNPGFCCAAKHFPGDGLDERDQHIANSVNTFSCEEWDKTFGKVYKKLIDHGLEAVMAGHIMQPAYTRYFNPEIKDEEIQPATLSPELLNGLLRGKLGFNGMILTDASHMVGLTSRMKRKDMIPRTIAAGVDMFLFFNDMEEDFQSMMEGYKNGIITEERLTDALRRILGLKAHMGLHKKSSLMPPKSKLKEVIGCQEHLDVAKEISEDGITLVKYLDEEVLPITPERYPRIMIVYVNGLEAKNTKLINDKENEKNAAQRLREKLEAKGFQVTIFENAADKQARLAAEGKKTDTNVYYHGKETVENFVSGQDLIVTLCQVGGHFQTVARPAWTMTKGGGEIPWYVHELPVVAVNVEHPTTLADMPQVRTFINTYDSMDSTLEILVEKLMTGVEAFRGKDPIDSFCGMWDTHF